eukprot:36294-Eustigmatos_ZCMA.PRE.1
MELLRCRTAATAHQVDASLLRIRVVLLEQPRGVSQLQRAVQCQNITRHLLDERAPAAARSSCPTM